MATNLTPPGDAVPARPFFPARQPSCSVFSPPFETGFPSWFQAIYDANRPVFLSTGPPSPFFTADALAVLPAHFHHQPLRNLAVVKPGIGLFAGLMEFSTFLEIYGINLSPSNSEMYLRVISSRGIFIV